MAPVQRLYKGGPANPDTSKPLYLLMVANTQTLYSAETLALVDRNARHVATFLNDKMPFEVRYGGTVKSPEEAQKTVAATNADGCIGLAAWFHTFSPGGLHQDSYRSLSAPYIHLVTSMDMAMPTNMDMAYMNGNQTPHGFEEGAHTLVRAGVRQNVVAGHYASNTFLEKLEMYGRAAAAVSLMRQESILRIGGKMSGVRGTDANVAELQKVTGMRVNDDYGPDAVCKAMSTIPDEAVKELIREWIARYETMPILKEGGRSHGHLQSTAKQTLAIKHLLSETGATAWTSYFGNLGRMGQLPAMAAQELMREGIGYGAEGDVKAAAMCRALFITGQGLPGTSSFSEPYVFDWVNGAMLYAHMAESNPLLAKGKARLEMHQLDIGQSGNPVRTVFSFAPGDCTLTSLIDVPPIGYQIVTTEGASSI